MVMTRKKLIRIIDHEKIKEAIQKAEGIECDFRRLDGYLFQGRGMPTDVIDRELEAVREVGAPVHRLVGIPLQGCERRHVLRYPPRLRFTRSNTSRAWPRPATRAASRSIPTVLCSKSPKEVAASS